MANGVDHRGKNETARTPSMRYQEDIEWRSARRSLLKSAIFALACRPVSKSRSTFPIGIGASKVQREGFLPVRGAVLRPNATPTIASEGV
jgi:hypothetical protein